MEDNAQRAIYKYEIADEDTLTDVWDYGHTIKNINGKEIKLIEFMDKNLIKYYLGHIRRGIDCESLTCPAKFCATGPYPYKRSSSGSW